MIALRGSTRKDIAMFTLPALNQSNTLMVNDPASPACRAAYTSPKISALTRNAPNTTPLPKIPINGFDNTFLPRPMIIKPNKGNRGTNQIKSIISLFKFVVPIFFESYFLNPNQTKLPFQTIERINIQRSGIAIYHHNNGQPHCYLSCCKRHDKENKHLSCRVTTISRKGRQQQVDRVEHQLNRHHDDDGIAADQHSNDTDRKNDGTKEDVMIEGDTLHAIDYSVHFLILYFFRILFGQ